jgi:hypothetical protein
VTKAKPRANAFTSSKVRDHSLHAQDLRRGVLSAEAPKVVTRYGAEGSVINFAEAACFAGCHTVEVATGGGGTFPNGDPQNPSYVIEANHPSVERGSPPDVF